MTLSRNTKLFSLASFLVDVSSEMAIPLLPFFLTSILGAPIMAVGLLDAVRELFSKTFGIFAGIYSDKTGRRKKMIIAGYSMSAVMKAVLAFATSWYHVIGIAMFERIGKGVRDAPRDALIVLSEKKEELGKAFGFRKLMDNFGAILGPLFASAFLVAFSNASTEGAYRNIFLIAIIPAAIAVVILFFVREIKTEGKGREEKIVTSVLENKNYKKLIIAQAIFGAGHFGILIFLLRGGEILEPALVPLIYLTYNAFYTIFTLPAGIMSDKIGAKTTTIFGYVFYLGGVFILATSANIQTILFPFALLGLFMAINEVAPNVLISKMVEKQYYGSAIGISKGVSGLVALPANIAAGLLWGFVGPSAVFAFGAITSLIGIIMLYKNVK